MAAPFVPRFFARRLNGIPLQAILVVPFVLQICLAVGVTGWLSWRNGQRAVNELAFRLQNELGHRVKLKLEDYLDTPLLVSRLNAQAIASGQLSIQPLSGIEPHLFQELRQFETVSGILVANAQGEMRAVNRRDGLNLLSRDPQISPSQVTEYALNAQGDIQATRQIFSAPDIRQAPWYQSAVEAEGLVWSPIFQTGDRPDLSLNASLPVYSADRKLLGVVSSGIALSVVGQFLRNLDISPNGGVFVVDRQGLLVGSSNATQPIYRPGTGLQGRFAKLERLPAEQAQDPLIRQTVQQLLAEFGGYSQVRAQQLSFRLGPVSGPGSGTGELSFLDSLTGGNHHLFVTVLPCVDELGIDWLILVVVPEQDFMAQINRNKQETLMLSGVALLGAIALGLITARCLARPILRLSLASQAIAQGQLDHQIPQSSLIREVATVGRSFNQMLIQLRQSFASLETQVEERTLALRQSFGFEETLKRLTEKVRDSLEEDQILQTAVQELAIATGVRGCNAAIYNLEEQTSTVQYEYTHFAKQLQGHVLQMKNFAGYPQLLAGQYFQHCGLELEPSRGPVAMLACPMQDDQGVLGDLWLVKPAAEVFSAQEIRLVQQVANQCAIALRQARLYQAAQAQVHELERLNQLKDDFLSTVSHELRTPIANMKMAIQMLEIGLRKQGVLQEGSAESSSPVQRYFEILKDECQRESKLINNLLDLSRLEIDAEPLKIRELTYPDKWLMRLVNPYWERIQHQRSFQVQIPDTLPPLHTDVTYLERILTELLTNACKYTPKGGAIDFRVTLTPSARDKTAYTAIVFEVINTGVEISQEEQNRVFERFYRIPSHDPWQHGGTGLGLALVKQLTERLNGTVELKSQDQWTRFVVQLPLINRPVQVEA